MTTTIQCNIGCHWLDAGVQCDLGYPMSYSTLLKQSLVEFESEISECEGDKEFYISRGTLINLKRETANCKFTSERSQK